MASRGWRLAAVLIDGIVMTVLALPLLLYFDVWTLVREGRSPAPLVLVVLFVWQCVSFIGVNWWLLQHRGQTIGKWCADVAIVGLDGRRQPAWHVLTWRYMPIWIVSQIPLLGAVLAWIDALFIFGSQRRCLHDRLARTKVVDIGPLLTNNSHVAGR